MYQEIVLEHAKHPKNFGVIENSTHSAKATNASCGDLLEFQLEIVDGTIQSVGWRGVSCAISTAAASVLSEMLQGKSLEEAQALELKHILEKLGMDSILPTREKCATLPLRALSEIKIIE